VWKFNQIVNYPKVTQDCEWALHVLDDRRIVKSCNRNLRYYDEPLLYQFGARTQDTFGFDEVIAGVEAGGASFDASVALCKSGGESAERFCLATVPSQSFSRGSFAEQSSDLDPDEFKFFLPSQLSTKHFECFRWDEDSSFYWREGFDVTRKRETMLPAQLVYLPYYYRDDERYIIPASTSGGACAKTVEQSTLSGMFELLERDAFMIHYLSRTEGIGIDLRGSPLFQEIEDYLAKFNLKLRTFLLQTDFPVCPVMAIITEESQSGVPAPWMSAGLKCSFDPSRSILGAIEEACQTRPWIRGILTELERGVGAPKTERISDILIDRAVYWSSRDKIKDLSFLLRSRRTIRFEDLSPVGDEAGSVGLDFLVDYCRRQGHPVYRVDITTPEVREHGLSVHKVIMPTLQQFYLNEPHMPLASTRWKDVPSQLGLLDDIERPHNPVPHFFL
jgi:ribosomal protein S12 methylthiotransferase accessory factor